MRLLSDYYACANPWLEPLSIEDLAATEDGGVSPVDNIPDGAPSPEERLHAVDIREAVQRFLDMLDARERLLVHRVFWDGHSQAQVARALDISGAAISKRMKVVIAKGADALGHLRGDYALQ